LNPKWHVAVANISICRYAGISFRQYYSSPEEMLAAQLKAADELEKKFGLKNCLPPFVDAPGGCLASVLGMRTVFSGEDELPALDLSSPVVKKPEDIKNLKPKNFFTDFNLSWRLKVRQYLLGCGYDCRLGGYDGSVMTTACQLTGSQILLWLLEEPETAFSLMKLLTEVNQKLEDFDNQICGQQKQSYGYIGDDFAGLVCPEMFQRFLIPCYEKIYQGKTWRFLHSELLTYQHLRLAKDYLDINEFHGAGCEKITFEEMRKVMGENFWVQLTPTELLYLTPRQIRQRIKVLAHSGAMVVQLYPGRDTPDRNLEEALKAVNQECSGGQLV